MLVFAWCKKGTTVPEQVGRHRIFTERRFAVSSWNSCRKNSSGWNALKLTDFDLVAYEITATGVIPVDGCKKCKTHIPCKEEMKNNDGFCWRCKRRW